MRASPSHILLTQILACDSVGVQDNSATGVVGGAGLLASLLSGRYTTHGGTAAAALADAAGLEVLRYGRKHWQWVEERYNKTGNPADNPALCAPGGTPGSCQVRQRSCKKQV